MSRRYGCIAFTDDVRHVQQDYGSAAFYDRMRSRAERGEDLDPLGPREGAFLAARDGFYLSTVGQTGWPYVQFRGGPVAVDYPRRQRLKLFGMAHVVRVEDDASYVSSLTVDGYDAIVEAAVTVTVTAFDWNCPQHIPQRFTLEQMDARMSRLQERVKQLEAENEALRRSASR